MQYRGGIAGLPLALLVAPWKASRLVFALNGDFRDYPGILAAAFWVGCSQR